MAFKFTIPFYAFKLHLPTGGYVLTALSDKQVLHMGQPLPVFAGKYAELLQSKILDKGQFQPLLDEFRDGDFIKDQLKVSFSAAKDGLRFPEFMLEFDFFFNQKEQGFWGMVPALGVESFAGEYTRLRERLEDAILLDFVRNRRLQAVQGIVSAIWFQATEMNQVSLDLQIPGLQSLDRNEEENAEKLLPQAAKLLEINHRVCYGREAELDQIARILKGKFGRNVLLVGPTGVGKTALIWELAGQMKKRKIKGQIWETTASTLIKELMQDTGWQENLALLCRELTGSPDLLYVRNLMELFEVGKYEGNDVSMAEYLRNYLSRGEVSLLSECSEDELARIQLQSPNYLSHFHIIRLEEPQQDLEAIILKKIKDIARSQKIDIRSEAIQEVIRLNKRYTPYAGMPGKPIRFLESMLLHQKQLANIRIGKQEIFRSFCEETGLPQFMIDPSLPMGPLKIKASFNQQVFGQEKAVAGVTDMLASVKTALARTGKPIASFLFVGPTGVGKTELAKVLADFMFGNREKMIRFDMSEFSSAYAVMRLLGLNYFQDGLLTSAVRRDPFCVLLFDEIEKAHPNFYDLLLQILSEGRLTDSGGKLVNFCSTIIIMTSNIGAGNLQTTRIGWSKEISREDINAHFDRAVQKHFRPELINRIDQIIAFEPLSEETVRAIVEREIIQIKAREGIKFRKLDLVINPEVYDYLAHRGYHRLYGARHLQRTIAEELIIPLSKELNVQDYDDHLIVEVNLKAGKINLVVQADPLGLDLLLEELEKINQADHVSRLRRSQLRLQEGRYFIRLLSELDIMEHQRKSRREKFWEDLPLAKKYGAYLEIRQRIEKTGKLIEDHEIDLGMNCLGISPYQPAVAQLIKDWETNFFHLKKDLIALMEPQYDHCHFSIYGKPIWPILRFYLMLFENKGFQVSGQLVWFRESYYHQMTTQLLQTETKSARDHSSSSPYLKTDLDLEEPLKAQPPKTGDTLQGVELSVYGPSAFLYLSPEEGLQKWALDAKEEHSYVVVIQNQVGPTPDKIHRRDFFLKKHIRRILEPNLVKDTTYQINRELKFNDWPDFLRKTLEENFEMAVEACFY